MKTCIICNPHAGGNKSPDTIVEQLRALEGAEICLTNGPGRAADAARRAIAGGCEVIVAAGGDGTLNEVVNGIATKAASIRLGLIPLGTGNDFSRMLKMPASIEESLGVLRAGFTRPVDLVRVTSDEIRYFLNVSAGGFSGLMNEKLTTDMKRTWGPLAYLRGAAAALPDLKAYQTSITFDDKECLLLDLYNVIVANGRYVAGGTPVAPEAEIDDGLLDVVLVPKSPAMEIAVVSAQILLGKHLASEAIVYRRAAKVVVNSRPGMWFNVDGELVGNEPAMFEVMPRAIEFVVPETA